MIPAPIPSWSPLCVISYPAAVVLANALLTGMRLPSSAKLPGAIAMGFALWAAVVHWAALCCGSFYAGLAWGTLALTAAAAAVAWPQARNHGKFLIGKFPNINRRDMALCLLGVAAIAPGALFFDFHDKTYSLYGHFYFTNNILNGAYPPRDPAFPEKGLAYHYGIDLVAALIAAVLRIDISSTFRLLVIVLWPCAILLGIALARACQLYKQARRAVFIMMFGGGLPWFATLGGASLTAILTGQFYSGNIAVNPPLVSYLFQHPWTLGLPLLLLQMLILVRSERMWPRGPKAMLGGILLGWASAFFNTTVAAVIVVAGVASLVSTLRRSVSPPETSRTLNNLRPVLMMTAAYVIGVSAGIAGSGLLYRMLFTAPPSEGFTFGGLILAPLGLSGTPRESLVWILTSGGLLLPLGLAGVRFLPRGRVVFAAALIFATAIPITFRFAYSWDIVKFLAAGMVLAAFPFEAACTRFTRYMRGPVGSIGGKLLLVLGCVAGVCWCVGVARAAFVGETFINKDSRRYLETAGWTELSPDDLSAISWLRARVRPCDLVYVPAPRFIGYGIYGGLPQFHIDANGRIFQQFRKDVLAARSGEPVQAIQGANAVTWFVLRSQVPEDRTILNELEQNSIVVSASKFGGVTIYERRGRAITGISAGCY